jgi:parallel beta-helix repeat protein
VTQSEVTGITVLGSRSAGINADGGGFSTRELAFTANTLGRNGAGILVTNLSSSTISENDVSGNGVGISIDNGGAVGPPLVLSYNILNGNTGDGLFITASSQLLFPTVTVQNNVLSGNGGNGMTVLIAVEITNNRSLANGMFDLVDTLPGCPITVWSGNTFFTANQSCIH